MPLLYIRQVIAVLGSTLISIFWLGKLGLEAFGYYNLALGLAGLIFIFNQIFSQAVIREIGIKTSKEKNNFPLRQYLRLAVKLNLGLLMFSLLSTLAVQYVTGSDEFISQKFMYGIVFLVFVENITQYSNSILIANQETYRYSVFSILEILTKVAVLIFFHYNEPESSESIIWTIVGAVCINRCFNIVTNRTALRLMENYTEEKILDYIYVRSIIFSTIASVGMPTIVKFLYSRFLDPAFLGLRAIGDQLNSIISQFIMANKAYFEPRLLQKQAKGANNDEVFGLFLNLVRIFSTFFIFLIVVVNIVPSLAIYQKIEIGTEDKNHLLLVLVIEILVMLCSAPMSILIMASAQYSKYQYFTTSLMFAHILAFCLCLWIFGPIVEAIIYASFATPLPLIARYYFLKRIYGSLMLFKTMRIHAILVFLPAVITINTLGGVF